MLKGLISCLSLEDSVSLNNAMTNCEARPHLLKAYKGIRSPAFDQHVYTGKEDFRGLRWAIEQGVDLQGIRLEMGVEKRAGKILRCSWAVEEIRRRRTWRSRSTMPQEASWRMWMRLWVWRQDRRLSLVPLEAFT